MTRERVGIRTCWTLLRSASIILDGVCVVKMKRALLLLSSIILRKYDWRA